MKYNYEYWSDIHNTCRDLIVRLCELNKKADKYKSLSALEVMSHSMQDIKKYFDNKTVSSAEICYLIRNIDFLITCILDLNNILFGIGLNKQGKAIEKCFLNPEYITKFRTLRSLVLAHPVDTNYRDELGNQKIIYLEDILPPQKFDYVHNLGEYDYKVVLCEPDSSNSTSHGLNVERDIVPAIKCIIESTEKLSDKVKENINEFEEKLKNTLLDLDKSCNQSYIDSLELELIRRYPSSVTDDELEDGSIRHYSIVTKYKKYLENPKYKDYAMFEYKKIEHDLQNMTFDQDEGEYFVNLENDTEGENNENNTDSSYS